jgi:hypothetical protein
MRPATKRLGELSIAGIRQFLPNPALPFCTAGWPVQEMEYKLSGLTQTESMLAWNAYPTTTVKATGRRGSNSFAARPN